MAEMTQFRQDISASEKANISALGDISATLEAALAEEREKAEQERQKLIAEFQKMINAMVENQHSRFSTAVDSVRQGLSASQSRVEGGFQLVSKGLDGWQERETVFSKKLVNNKEEVKKSIVEASKSADQRGAAIQESARRVHAQTIELVDSQMKALDQKTQALDDFVVKGINLSDMTDMKLEDMLLQDINSMKNVYLA
jgi:kinesin family member 11